MDPLPSPSEQLCEVGLELASRLNRYEESGGTSHLEDVVSVAVSADMFDRAASVVGKPRPGWRWEIRLRDGRDVETVVGHANGRWSVEGIDMLEHAAPGGSPCVVVIEPPGTDLEFKPPPAEKTSPSTGVSYHRLYGPLVAFGMRKATAHRLPRWHPDPARRFRLRYWNGERWSRFVTDSNDASPGWDESLDWGNRYRLPKL